MTDADADRQIAFLGDLTALGVGQHIFTLDDPTDPAVWDLLARRIIPAATSLA